MCTVIVGILINSGSDNCLSLVLFSRNHKQPKILTIQLGMSRTGNKMLDFFKNDKCLNDNGVGKLLDCIFVIL